MLIGSSEFNDIVIKAPGVSRKHLLVTTKDGQGKSVELTSTNLFKLGQNILLSLLSDAEAKELGFDSALIKSDNHESSTSEANQNTTLLPLAIFYKVWSFIV